MNGFCIFPKTRALCLCLSLVFLVQQTVYGVTPPAAVALPSDALPADPAAVILKDYATVSDYYIPGSDALPELKKLFTGPAQDLIIYIEDAHGNISAQKNIASVIEVFKEHSAGKKVTIALEGTETGEIDPSVLTAIPDENIRRLTAEIFLQRGEFDGADYFLSGNPAGARLFGVDSLALVREIHESYRGYLAFREANEAALAKLVRAGKLLRGRVYDREMLYLDSLIAKKDRGGMAHEYFAELVRFALEKSISLKAYPQLLRYQEIREAEKQAGENAEANVRLQTLIGGLQGKAMLDDLKSLEADLWHQLLTYREAREVHEIATIIRFYEQLFSFSLLPDNFRDYQKDPYRYSFKKLRSLLRRYNFVLRPRSLRPHQADFTVFESAAKKCLDFYAAAAARDRPLAENLMRLSEEYSDANTIFIAGGFHREEITRILRDRRVGYVVLTPRITGKEGQENYWRLMANSLPLQTFPDGIASHAKLRSAHADPAVRLDVFQWATFLNLSGLAGVQLPQTRWQTSYAEPLMRRGLIAPDGLQGLEIRSDGWSRYRGYQDTIRYAGADDAPKVPYSLERYQSAFNLAINGIRVSQYQRSEARNNLLKAQADALLTKGNDVSTWLKSGEKPASLPNKPPEVTVIELLEELDAVLTRVQSQEGSSDDSVGQWLPNVLDLVETLVSVLDSHQEIQLDRRPGSSYSQSRGRLLQDLRGIAKNDQLSAQNEKVARLIELLLAQDGGSLQPAGAAGVASTTDHELTLEQRLRVMKEGDRFGRNGQYEVAGVLGKGGMATVYRVRDLRKRPGDAGYEAAMKVFLPKDARQARNLLVRGQRELTAMLLYGGDKTAGAEVPLAKADVSAAAAEDQAVPELNQTISSGDLATLDGTPKQRGYELPAVPNVLPETGNRYLPVLDFEGIRNRMPGYIIMPLVDGASLKDMFDFRRKLSQREAVKIAIQTLRQLKIIHQGEPAYIHRDISPRNILVDDRGNVTLIDLGMTNTLDGANKDVSVLRQGTMTTEENDVFGTPELAPRDMYDSRAAKTVSIDIYSLGLILYSMVTGRYLPALERNPGIVEFDDRFMVHLQHAHGNIENPGKYNPLIPAELERIILRMISPLVSREGSASPAVPGAEPAGSLPSAATLTGRADKTASVDRPEPEADRPAARSKDESVTIQHGRYLTDVLSKDDFVIRDANGNKIPRKWRTGKLAIQDPSRYLWRYETDDEVLRDLEALLPQLPTREEEKRQEEKLAWRKKHAKRIRAGIYAAASAVVFGLIAVFGPAVYESLRPKAPEIALVSKETITIQDDEELYVKVRVDGKEEVRSLSVPLAELPYNEEKSFTITETNPYGSDTVEVRVRRVPPVPVVTGNKGFYETKSREYVDVDLFVDGESKTLRVPLKGKIPDEDGTFDVVFDVTNLQGGAKSESIKVRVDTAVVTAVDTSRLPASAVESRFGLVAQGNFSGTTVVFDEGNGMVPVADPDTFFNPQTNRWAYRLLTHPVTGKSYLHRKTAWTDRDGPGGKTTSAHQSWVLVDKPVGKSEPFVAQFEISSDAIGTDPFAVGFYSKAENPNDRKIQWITFRPDGTTIQVPSIPFDAGDPGRPGNTSGQIKQLINTSFQTKKLPPANRRMVQIVKPGGVDRAWIFSADAGESRPAPELVAIVDLAGDAPLHLGYYTSGAGQSNLFGDQLFYLKPGFDLKPFMRPSTAVSNSTDGKGNISEDGAGSGAQSRSELRKMMQAMDTSTFSSLLVLPYSDGLFESLRKAPLPLKGAHVVLVAPQATWKKVRSEIRSDAALMRRMYHVAVVPSAVPVEKLREGSAALDNLVRQSSSIFGISPGRLGRPVLMVSEASGFSRPPLDLQTAEIVYLQMDPERLVREPDYRDAHLFVGDRLSKWVGFQPGQMQILPSGAFGLAASFIAALDLGLVRAFAYSA